MPQSLTLLHPGGLSEVAATIDAGRVSLAPEIVRDTLGWKLEPRGLCQGDLCVPVSDPGVLETEGGLDLAALCGAIGLPMALDLEAGVAAVGTAHADRAARLDNLEAPDFSLPDLHGAMHSLSDHRGKKVLLIVYASW